MRYIQYVIAIALVSSMHAMVFAFDDSSIVKLSSSGICHPPESPYYNRTIDQSNGSLNLKACLAAGHRLPKQLQKLYNAEVVLTDDKASTAAKALALEDKADVITEQKKEKQDSKEFGGLRFGFGLGMSFLGNQIDEVRILDGNVVVKKQRSNQGRAILESHKFIWTSSYPGDEEPIADLQANTLSKAVTRVVGREWGFGPFVTASLADDQGAGLLSAYGIGLMAGFRSKDSSSSWNLGVAWFVDTEVKALRPGIVDGMATSLMNSDDLTKTVDEEGIIIIVSGSW